MDFNYVVCTSIASIEVEALQWFRFDTYYRRMVLCRILHREKKSEHSPFWTYTCELLLGWRKTCGP